MELSGKRPPIKVSGQRSAPVRPQGFTMPRRDYNHRGRDGNGTGSDRIRPESIDRTGTININIMNKPDENDKPGLDDKPEESAKLEYVSDYYLDISKLKYLETKLPHAKIANADYARPHSHPILNFDRGISEQVAVTYAQMQCNKMQVNIDKFAIDIGGNPSRHAKFGRKIWSCNPILSPSDVIRKKHHAHNHYTCDHDALLCTCFPSDYLFSYAIAVDSIYYLTPAQIVSMINRTESGILVAAFHEFTEAIGTFANGEATYVKCADDMVSMYVKGNTRPYVNSTMPWLRRSHLRIGKHTLVWEKIGETAEHSIYCFQTTPIVFSDPIENVVPNLHQVIYDRTYYGSVVYNDKATVSVPLETVKHDKMYFCSTGSWISIFDIVLEDGTTTMHAPKGLVEHGMKHVTGKKRTPDSFMLLRQHLTHRVKQYNIPDAYCSNAVFSAAVIAFVAGVEHEISTLYSVLKPKLPLIKKHTRALDFEFDEVWNVGTIAAGVIAAGAAVGAALGVGPLAVAGIGAASAAALVYSNCNKQDTVVTAPLSNYLENRSGDVSEPRVAHIPLRAYPATKPSSSLYELSMTPIDPTAEVTVDGLEDGPSKTQIYPCGIVSSTAPPITSDATKHNLLSAIIERQLVPQVYNMPGFDHDNFYDFMLWVLLDEPVGVMRISNIDRFFPDFGTVIEDYDSWNKRYPLSLRNDHDRALERLKNGSANDDHKYDRKSFAKIEAILEKNTPDGVKGFKPRLITAGTDEMNVETGPFIYAFQNRLKKVWNPHHPLVYGSGFSALELGRSIEEFCNAVEPHVIVEGDYSKFDSTVHEGFLLLEIAIFTKFGATDQAVHAWKSSIDKYAKTRNGIKYSVTGTRSSGDNQTSCGNSILQTLATMYSLFRVLGSKLFYDIYDQGLLKYYACGDDNLLILPDSIIPSASDDHYLVQDQLAKLGLNLKPKIYRGVSAINKCTFLSCHVYPVTFDGVQTRCLGPNIGRVYAKFGWYVNIVPHLFQSYVAGDAKGRYAELQFIPFLRKLIKRTAELTASVNRVIEYKEARRSKRERMEYNEGITFHPMVWQTVLDAYGLTPDQEEEYDKLLQQVKTLPCIVNYPPLDRAAQIDGCAVIEHQSAPVDEHESIASYFPIETDCNSPPGGFMSASEAFEDSLKTLEQHGLVEIVVDDMAPPPTSYNTEKLS